MTLNRQNIGWYAKQQAKKLQKARRGSKEILGLAGQNKAMRKCPVIESALI
jgi:hypothetical protein